MINDIEISNRLKGQRNNAQGKFFEHCIEAACLVEKLYLYMQE